jgi:hypothetical protein
MSLNHYGEGETSSDARTRPHGISLALTADPDVGEATNRRTGRSIPVALCFHLVVTTAP